MKLSTRLMLYYLTATLLSLALVGFAILKAIEHYGMETVEQQLKTQSDSASVYVAQSLLLEKLGPQELAAIAPRLTGNLSAGSREVRIYDEQLQLLSAAVDGVQQTVQVEKPFTDTLTAALKGNYAYGIHNSDVYFASPVELQGAVIGVLEFVYPLHFLNQILTATQKVLYAGAVVFGMLITILSIYIARKVVKPIKQLVEVTQRFARRDFTPVHLPRNDEIGQLSRSFSEMGSQLQDYIQRQRQFVANVSHELRTPLTAIKGYSEYLTDEVKGRADLEKAVYHLNNESTRLAKLVNELLFLSRMDARREPFYFSRLDFSSLVQETLEKLQVRTLKYEVRLQADLQPNLYIWADEEKITQALMNLLDNAIKYSPPRGSVEIELYLEGTRGILAIMDRGMGIPAEDLHKIFERFYRSANTKAIGGTGLGLAITREIITAHKGSLDVANRPGGGTVVKITLPTA